jgi:methylation protein EvaC
MIGAERDAGRAVAGWGASAKSATLLNWCGIGPDLMPWIEDITPGKIGRYAPGSKIPIRVAGGYFPDTYLMTAWNYLPGMIHRRATRKFLDDGGRLIVPGPVPVLI